MGKTFERIKEAGANVWRPAVVDVATVRGRLVFTKAQRQKLERARP